MPEYELNIRDYWLILRRRRLVAIAVFVIVLMCMIIYTKSQTVLYKASTTVRIMEHKTLGTLLTGLMSEVPTNMVDTEVKIIKTRPVLERVARELNLIPKKAADREIYEAISYLSSIIKSELLPNTSLIRIEVVHPDPNKAAEIANKTAESYKLENLLEKNKEARTLREFLEVQLADIKERLKKSEDTLRGFKEKEGVTGIAVALTANLANLETEKSKLLQIYTEKYPDVAKLDEQINSLKQKMLNISAKELEFARLTREVELTEQTYKTFQSKFEEVRISEAEKVSDVSILDRASPPRKPFKPNVHTNVSLGIAIGLVLALVAALVTEQLDTSLGTIESIEDALKLPVLSVMPFLRSKQKEEKKGIFKYLPFDFSAKQNATEQLKAQIIINYSSKSSIFESYRMLYTNLRLKGFNGVIKNKIIQITSSNPEEGKSVTSMNLAIVMAQEGLKTLLVDTDLRKSVIHKVFELKKEPGFTDVVMGTVDLKDAVKGIIDIMATKTIDFERLLKTPGLDNLSILPAGTSIINVTQLLNSSGVTSLFENLRQNYDVVIMDSPPALAVSDPFTIASKMDGVILVYRVGKTASAAILRVKNQLEAVNAPIKGVVLNNVTPDVEMYSTYYYQYGKYYDDDKKNRGKTA